MPAVTTWPSVTTSLSIDRKLHYSIHLDKLLWPVGLASKPPKGLISVC